MEDSGDEQLLIQPTPEARLMVLELTGNIATLSFPVRVQQLRDNIMQILNLKKIDSTLNGLRTSRTVVDAIWKAVQSAPSSAHSRQSTNLCSDKDGRRGCWGWIGNLLGSYHRDEGNASRAELYND
jgi:hypothetical protein